MGVPAGATTREVHIHYRNAHRVSRGDLVTDVTVTSKSSRSNSRRVLERISSNGLARDRCDKGGDCHNPLRTIRIICWVFQPLIAP